MALAEAAGEARAVRRYRCAGCEYDADDDDEGREFRLQGRGADLHFCCMTCLAHWAVEQLSDRTAIS